MINILTTRKVKNRILNNNFNTHNTDVKQVYLYIIVGNSIVFVFVMNIL